METKLATTESPAAPPIWRRLVAPVVILLLMAAGYALGLHKYLTLESLAENRASLQTITTDYRVLAVLGYILIYATAVALSLPGAVIMTIAGGLLFGWIVGGLATVVGATLGATIVFQVAKSSFGDSLTRRAGPYLNKIKDGFAADAFNYLLFLRLVPAFPFWLVNIAPALANVRLRTFVLATFSGIIPGTFAFSFVGAGLDSVIDKQQAQHADCVAKLGADACPFELSVSSLITTELLLAFAALGVVALIPVVVKKMKRAS